MRFAFPAAGVALLFASVATAGDPATAPGLTKAGIRIGKDTTVVDGPVLEDGTIDYIAAYNAVAGKGVTKDNNAAVILLPLWGKSGGLQTGEQRAKIREILGVGPEKPGELVFRSFGDFLRDAKSGEASDLQEMEAEEAVRRRIVSAEEQPEMARWVESQGEILRRVVEASKRERYFIPAVGTEESQGLLQALSHAVQPMRLCRTLQARANFMLAKGDLDAALRDVRAALRIARLIENSGPDLDVFIGSAAKGRVLEQLRAWAASGKLTAAQAGALIREIDALPPRQAGSSAIGTSAAERFYTLDLVMEIRRGRGQDVMRILFARFSDKTPIDLGALGEADPNIMLRIANAVMDEGGRIAALPTHRERQAATEKTMAARAKRDTPVLPINTFFESITTLPAGTMPNLLDAAAAREAAVVAYLKRRAGESRDAYSTRMGQLLFEQPVQFGFGTVLEERIAWEGLTKIGLALAAYRADHQRYPERLAALSPGYLKEVPKDHFSGEPPVYRGNAEGFTLHSVGANLKDDGGKDKKEGGDDLVMKTP